ncbi:hypothetical protein TL16_g07959 [Triparma laevis f. inornata]|uniref:EF-hand domain-containing protein n=1 Tax=Triparma laevis f. inornata TaxID=1714386 RepID=A0A9W7EI77_9STRA|nr:hypothetical protein TL16_g07959 [Triparma laevis f. inornata]
MTSTFTLSLTRKIASKSSNILDTFMEMDLDGDGSISRSDLALSIKNLFNINLTRQQLNALASKFGMSSSRRVNYSKFVDTIRDLATASPLTSSSYGAGEDLHRGGSWDDDGFARLGIVSVPEAVTKAELLRVISRKIRSRSAVTGKITQTFLAIDESRTGKITIPEFREFLKNVGLDVSSSKCSEILSDYLTPENTVRMSGFATFVKDLAPSREVQGWEKLDDESLKRQRTVAAAMAKNARIALEESVRKCVDDAMTDVAILESLSETLLFKRMTLVKAFRKFDLSHDGKISRTEFAEGLKTCGVEISDERAAKLIDKFDVKADGKLACWEWWLPPAPSLVVKDDETEDVQAQIASSLVPDEETILLNFKQSLEEEKRKLRTTFQRLAEGGRSVSADQLMVGLKELGCKIDEEASERIVEKYDVDGSGELKYFEFIRMMNDIA